MPLLLMAIFDTYVQT